MKTILFSRFISALRVTVSLLVLLFRFNAPCAPVNVIWQSEMQISSGEYSVTLNGQTVKTAYDYWNNCRGVSGIVQLELGVVYTCYIDTVDGTSICGASIVLSKPVTFYTTNGCEEVYINGVLTGIYQHFKANLHDSCQIEVRPKKVQFTWNLPKEN